MSGVRAQHDESDAADLPAERRQQLLERLGTPGARILRETVVQGGSSRGTR